MCELPKKARKSGQPSDRPEDCEKDGSGLFSRELRDTSMADDGGRPGSARGIGLQRDRFLETEQLVVGKDAQEALQ